MFFRPRVKQLTVANPCHESWEAMDGGERQRFCTACNRPVHNLSALTRRQAAELFAQNGGKLCGRITCNESGNQIFAKERNPFERLVQLSVLGVSATASVASAQTCQVKVRVTDPSGAVVPNAPVKISNPSDPEALTSGASNDRGEFSGPVAPGTYSLQVVSAGFAPSQQQLTCKTAETVSIDAPLQLGVLSQTVSVEAPLPEQGVTMGVIAEVRRQRFPLFRKLLNLFRRL